MGTADGPRSRALGTALGSATGIRQVGRRLGVWPAMMSLICCSSMVSYFTKRTAIACSLSRLFRGSPGSWVHVDDAGNIPAMTCALSDTCV